MNFWILGSLSQSVLAFSLVYCEAADARMGTASISNGHYDYDLVDFWSVLNAHFHGVEVRSNESGVLVMSTKNSLLRPYHKCS